MPAERIALKDALCSPDISARTGQRVVAGEIFVYPTETIYGIGGRCDREGVRRRILAAKRRPPSNPMILIAASRRQLATLDLIFPHRADTLARACWPGPLTLVLPGAGGGTLGVRVSDHPLIAALTAQLCLPLFSTSANISGEAYDADPERIYELFSLNVDFMIDGGVLPRSSPSTVVEVDRDNTVRVLREGAVAAQEVNRLARC